MFYTSHLVIPLVTRNPRIQDVKFSLLCSWVLLKTSLNIYSSGHWPCMYTCTHACTCACTHTERKVKQKKTRNHRMYLKPMKCHQHLLPASGYYASQALVRWTCCKRKHLCKMCTWYQAQLCNIMFKCKHLYVICQWSQWCQWCWIIPSVIG